MSSSPSFGSRPAGRPSPSSARSFAAGSLRAVRARLTVGAAVAVALVVAAPALAGPPPVSARAYFVQNGATGEVLAARARARRLPIASITKLMTVLVTLDRTRLSHVVTVAPGAASVGESSIHLRAGERLTVRDLLEAALIQSANDAADALAYDVGRGDEGRFVALMNARARALRLRDTHFARPDGLDAAGHYSSARDITLLARVAMQRAAVRSIVRERTATIAGGRVLHTWNDLLGTFPGLIGVKTGHTAGAGWCEVGAVRGGSAAPPRGGGGETFYAGATRALGRRNAQTTPAGGGAPLPLGPGAEP